MLTRWYFQVILETKLLYIFTNLVTISIIDRVLEYLVKNLKVVDQSLDKCMRIPKASLGDHNNDI